MNEVGVMHASWGGKSGMGRRRRRSRGIFCFFFLFSMCSHHVPIKIPKFSSCSPKVFPMAPQFYPIWFAQSSTLMDIN
jgi:hypothetical protein